MASVGSACRDRKPPSAIGASCIWPSCSTNRPTRIDPDAKFARLGLDSAKSVSFLMDLEEWLAIELPTDTVFERSSMAELTIV